jgi:hypothetical protein
MNIIIRRGAVAGLGAAAAVLAVAGLAATAQADDLDPYSGTDVGTLALSAAAGLAAPAAPAADDIDMYGGSDVSTLTLYNGTGDAAVFTTTTDYYETVDETTGVMTPHFTAPITVETMQALAPGVTQEGGYSFMDSNTQFFGDQVNVIQTTSIDTDAFLANGHDLTQFVPLFVTDLFTPAVMDGDIPPF